MRKFTLSTPALLMIAAASVASGATFQFGGDANGLTDQSSATLTDEGVSLTLEATPTGAQFNERGSGMGINARSVPGVVGGEIDKFDLISGSSPFTGQGEGVRFSFDQPGILKELDFDGVKDEDFEYFLLQTSTSPDLYFFDSFNGSTADPSTIDVPGVVMFLQEAPGGGGSGELDDRSEELFIRFAAGQEFLLVYGQLGAGNGAQLQEITVQTIPEPATLLGAALAGGVLGLRCRRA